MFVPSPPSPSFRHLLLRLKVTILLPYLQSPSLAIPPVPVPPVLLPSISIPPVSAPIPALPPVPLPPVSSPLFRLPLLHSLLSFCPSISLPPERFLFGSGAEPSILLPFCAFLTILERNPLSCSHSRPPSCPLSPFAFPPVCLPFLPPSQLASSAGSTEKRLNLREMPAGSAEKRHILREMPEGYGVKRDILRENS